MKIKMDNDYNRNNNNNNTNNNSANTHLTSTTSTSSSGSTATNFNYNLVNTATSTSGDSSCPLSPMLANNSSTSSSTSASTSSTTTGCNTQPTAEPHNNEAQNLIEQFVHHHQQLQFNNNNNNNKQTLSRQHQVFDNLLHHHHHLHHHANNTSLSNEIGSQSPKFTNSNRFGANMACQYVEINGQSNTPQPPQLPPPIVHSTQATTAYLVQTPNGSALLIPPQTALNPTNHFIQTNTTTTANSAQQQQNNTFSLNRNPYGITTIPLQNAAAILNSNPSNTLIPHSSSVTSGACFNNRPESTTSTNVYQTIDTEKNGYLYPLESYYDSSSFNNNTTSTTTNTNNNCSTRQKYRRNYQTPQQQQQQQLIQQQQQQQFQIQQQGQFVKLMEAHNNSSNLTGTLRSNTNNTNSNFFVSPALSAASNRRHTGGSLLERLKFRLTQKLKSHGSWKCLAILFLFITLNLFTFTIYLAIMRMYNLNWHLKENQQSALAKHQLINDRKSMPIIFSKIGDTTEDQILPYEFFSVQLFLDRPAHVKFNVTFTKNSNLGIYAEKNSPPTYTKFKFFETFNGNTLITKNTKSNKISKRSSPGNILQPTIQSSLMVNTGFIQFLDEGLWYFALLNDNKTPLKFRFRTQFYDNSNSKCLMNCNGKGECVNGKCQCFPEFSGVDCSQSTCPVICNGRGKYESGKCVCELGWHGDECELLIDQCKISNCNGNGECVRGKCLCLNGFEGESCEKLTCPAPNCSNHGVCIGGQCVCFGNYTGADCGELVAGVMGLCSGHGSFDYATKSCRCERGWSAPDCSRNENCLDKLCSICKNGWTGLNCLEKAAFSCDIRCSEHGICVNGTCNCSPGYQGRNCDINNCPNGCSSNGICERVSNGYNRYQCVCGPGWTGRACDVMMELTCNDDIDNDKDGLTDCMDSECCGFDNCKLSLACSSSPEPKDRLLRKQPPSLSATFFEKMRFLIEDDSVQAFANSNSFSDSQVSVIRGQVLFKNGQALIGVKVSVVSNPAYGYTLTRNNGIFDLMVNGGGAILLEFSRTHLKTRQMSIQAAWNQFVYIDPVVLYLSEDGEVQPEPAQCKTSPHNTSEVRPVVKTSWKEIRTYYYDNSLILPDSGVVRNELSIVDTDLKLVYASNQASGFSSTIFLLLTHADIPDTLQQVHLQIVVEGVQHKQTFDAHPELKYEYAWDKRNAYEQRVYGLTTAKVSIGYQYEGCAFVYWHSSVVKLAGFDLGSSEISNWNIDVHHRLNTQQGILHKGDGTTIYLKEIQKQVEAVAGEFKQKRDLNCFQCKEEIKFYSPYSLSINKDGLIFVGDFNFVWMLNGSEPGKRVLEMRMDQAYKYYMANEPSTGRLFVADSVKRQFLTVKSFESLSDLKSNSRISNGLCSTSSLDSLDCAPDKYVQYPKGFAFDYAGVMYFIDGSKVKSLSGDDVVRTLVGDELQYRPMDCRASFRIEEMRFYWPTSLVINPVDNRIHVLDEGVVYRLSEYGTVEVVAGVPFACDEYQNDNRNFIRLNSPVDIAFNPDGDLFVLENDKRKIKQIKLIKSNGDVEIYFGDANTKSAGSFEIEPSLNFDGFNDPVSIAVHQNRSVYVLDKGDNVLYHIKNLIVKNEFTGKYTIVSPETREAYLFNKFGLHLNTIDLTTGQIAYNFTYNGNHMYGKLIGITDKNKILLSIKRDFNGRAELIQTASSYTIRLKLNNFDMLRSLSTSDNRNYSFNYLGNTGLLTSKVEPNEKLTTFNYEKNGKVKEIIEANNLITNISYFINSSGIVTVMNRADLYTETWITNGSFTYIYKNGKLETLMESNKANLNIRTLSSEDSLSSLKLYSKSILNYKPNKFIKNEQIHGSNFNRRKNSNSKRNLDKILFFS